ncbi:hypothetical protein T05_13712 [Trichinella murrelli]|uniref:Uncharacterized protein n=1 Tax=Trichinella murrelli TaxID=144512 RepID=A0A0V0TQY4_9BILA|nr:hypothetical protein T05_13712 [Trichinella murrelli]
MIHARDRGMGLASFEFRTSDETISAQLGYHHHHPLVEKRQAKLDDKRLAKAEQMQPMRPIVGERYWIIVKSSRLAAKQDDKK